MKVALNTYPPDIPTGLGTLARTLSALYPFADTFYSQHRNFQHKANWAQTVSRQEVQKALEPIDCVLAVERCMPDYVFEMAKSMGKRTVLIVMHEWLHPTQPWFAHTDLFVAPNNHCASVLLGMGLPSAKIARCNIPMNFMELPYVHCPSEIKSIAFVNGWGGWKGRKGYAEMMEAININSMREGWVNPVVIHSLAPVGLPHYKSHADSIIDLYRDHDAAFVPSHVEGLGLGILEPMALGLPVFATDAPPMNEYLEGAYSDLTCTRIPVQRIEKVRTVKEVDAYICDVKKMAMQIYAATLMSSDFVEELSRRGRAYIKEQMGEQAKDDLWRAITC